MDTHHSVVIGEPFNFSAYVGLWDVHYQITIRRLIAIWMVVGLVLAPISRPVMAGSALDASIDAMAGDSSMSASADEMAEDMPCCPAKAPAPFDCDKCVSMTSCMGQCVVGISSATFRPPFAPSSRIARLQNDSWPEGLGHPPPEYPPRRLV